MKYRPEVDGLRTVAVLPVLLFHADVALFAGGFVGVDVFFVISGYLITTILISDISKGRYSLLRFYERRARRILPALFLVTLCTTPFALTWLAPDDLRDYAQSLVGVVTFSSNILFWAESGYFGGDAALKPLLHTWSLAVEEQYYILFPPMLYFLWRIGVARLVMVLGGLLLASLALACWMVITAPEAAFYLLPTRGWQLLAGALTAFFLFYRPAPAPGALAQLGGICGLALIAWSIFMFDHHTPFPALPALVPVLGCVLLILFAVPGTLVQAILAQRLFVGIGLISFSVYLWHQPLLAFAKYRSYGEQSVWLMLALCLVSLPLAWATWRFVETPFRNKEAVPLRMVVRSGALIAVVLAGVGVAGHQTGGFRELIVAYRAQGNSELYQAILRASEGDGSGLINDGECRFGGPELTGDMIARIQECAGRYGPGVLVIGDSHAMNIYNGLAKAELQPFIVALARGGCRPYDTKPGCYYEPVLANSAILNPAIGTIIYHQSGAHFVADAAGEVDSQRAFRENDYEIQPQMVRAVAEYLERLDEAFDAHIVWLGPFVEYRYNINAAVYGRDYLKLHPVSVSIFAMLEKQLKEMLSPATAFEYVSFEDVYEIPQSVYDGTCFHFRDTDHFSRCGELAFGTAPGTRALLDRVTAQPGS